MASNGGGFQRGKGDQETRDGNKIQPDGAYLVGRVAPVVSVVHRPLAEPRPSRKVGELDPMRRAAAVALPERAEIIVCAIWHGLRL